MSQAWQQLRKRQAKPGACTTLHGAAEIEQQTESLRDIEAAEAALQDLRAPRKATARKVSLESLTPEPSPTQQLPLDMVVGSDDPIERASNESEERSLLDVGSTRARKQAVVMSYGSRSHLLSVMNPPPS